MRRSASTGRSGSELAEATATPRGCGTIPRYGDRAGTAQLGKARCLPWQPTLSGRLAEWSALPAAGHISRTAYARKASLHQGVDRDPGEGFDLDSHHPAQGFTIFTPMSSKSRTLRVASLIREAAAMAAIWQSAEATGRPAERRAAAM